MGDHGHHPDEACKPDCPKRYVAPGQTKQEFCAVCSARLDFHPSTDTMVPIHGCEIAQRAEIISALHLNNARIEEMRLTILDELFPELRRVWDAASNVSAAVQALTRKL